MVVKRHTSSEAESFPRLERAEGRDLAKQFQCPFIETSAKQRLNVDEAFSMIVKEIRKYNKVSCAHGRGMEGFVTQHVLFLICRNKLQVGLVRHLARLRVNSRRRKIKTRADAVAVA